MTLDSLGVTWLMMDTNTGERLWVIAVTCIDMLKSSSATWPWLSPNGPSGSSKSVSIMPSITISASAGTSGLAPTLLRGAMGRPAKPPGAGHLILIEHEFRRPGKDPPRRATDHDRPRHRLLAPALLPPVMIPAGAADPTSHAHAQP